jgi:hypothetical protein
MFGKCFVHERMNWNFYKYISQIKNGEVYPANWKIKMIYPVYKGKGK